MQPSESFRILGVVIDNTLSFDAHVNFVCKAVNYQAKALRHIQKRLTTDVALTIASKIVGSRLDYCNAILHGQRHSTMCSELYCTHCNWHEVISTHHSALARLHWLKIAEQIE